MRENKLLRWVSSGEFERFYTRKFRLTAHIILWLIIFSIHFTQYKSIYREPLSASLVFALRNLLGNAFFFYFVLYYVTPRVFLRGRILPAIICIPILLFVHAALNYLACAIIYPYIQLPDEATRNTVAAIVRAGLFSKYLFGLTISASWNYVTWVAPCIAIKLVLDIARHTTNRLRMQRDKLDLELNFLKSQLNPHFLFNTLNNIYTLSLKGDPFASDLVLHLSSMMRYTIYESDTPQVPLRKEVEFLKNYVQLESVRYGPKADIRLDYDEADIKDQQVGPLLVFPFVENAFKHGQNTAKGKWLVQVRIRTQGPIIDFEIVNSINPASAVNREVGGIGQVNSRKRLELLYPGRHVLTIENTDDLYKVKLTLTQPIQLHGKKN